jgi:hypothetical protein
LDWPSGIVDLGFEIVDLRAQYLDPRNSCSLNLQSPICNHKS